MINIGEVIETNDMVEKENLDVRTITLGISLLDCIDSDLAKVNENIYSKITTLAKNLVATGKEIENNYCIPIVNKRISVTPIALVGGAACKSSEDFVTIAKTLDRAAKEVGVNFIGGYSALVSPGMQLCKCWLYKNRNQHGCSKADWRDDKGDSRGDKAPSCIRLCQVCSILQRS